VQRDEGEDLAGPERPGGALGHSVGHAEIGHDRVRLERHVLLDLDVADDEAEVGELGDGGASAGLVDRLGVAVDADDGATEGRQREREPPRAGPRVQHGQLAERLGLEALEKRRAQLVGRIGKPTLSP
jgi:hypothetical protein